eukprot:sb/3471520/
MLMLNALSPIRYLDKIEVPLLTLNAADDPIIAPYCADIPINLACHQEKKIHVQTQVHVNTNTGVQLTSCMVKFFDQGTGGRGVFLTLFQTHISPVPDECCYSYTAVVVVHQTVIVYYRCTTVHTAVIKDLPNAGIYKNDLMVKIFAKVRFKRIDLRFLEIGVLLVVFTKRDPEFSEISGQVV